MAPWALCLAAACSLRGTYVWVDDYQPPAGAEAYVIQPGDVLALRILNQEELTSRARVRTDGHISLPLLNEVQAAGLTPAALSQQVQAQLANYLRNPVVTLSLEETQPLVIAVTGEVMRPGRYELEPRAGVLHALASAGGLSQFARLDRVFVLRRTEPSKPPQRIRFDYEQLSRAEGRGAAFLLQRNDVIVVE